MTGKNVIWLVVYYLVVATFLWLVSQDAPIPVVLWYKVHRAGYLIDRLGKRQYNQALERTRL
jgi:hypothetical protein